MAKPKTAFFCSDCGQETSGWMGKCPGCGSWNTIVEEKIKPSPPAAGGSRGWFVDSSFSAKNQPKAVYLSEIEPDPGIRFSTGIGELDRVLGGGFVAGSIVLVGGDPGIGKSTLLMQVCGNMSQSGDILYVSGEESAQQIRLRSDRLGIPPDSIRILQQTAFLPVVESIQEIKPVIVVVDSIQTLYTDELSAPPGSVSQVREVTSGLLRIAKSTGTVIVLIGHVTKDGAIAGPRVLEHMVDTVLYFESSNQQPTRILRAVKNRFGTTDEIGLFEMTGQGLVTVQNASAAMLEGRPVGVPGTAVTACMEGTRPILIEIQALLSGTAYPAAQRMTQGLDRNRVSMILAVLEKQLSAGLYNMDAFVNIIGGIRSDDPSLDLAIAASILSSLRNQPIRNETILFGELGLTGEVRPVTSPERRLSEAFRMGFTLAVLPGGCKKAVMGKSTKELPDLLFVDNLGEMIDSIF